jgi:hypothetical protein
VQEKAGLKILWRLIQGGAEVLPGKELGNQASRAQEGLTEDAENKPCFFTDLSRSGCKFREEGKEEE